MKFKVKIKMFLKNLFRYPKFLLSSIIGLITIIISNVIFNLKKFKIKGFFSIVTSLIVLMLIIIFFISLKHSIKNLNNNITF